MKIWVQKAYKNKIKITHREKLEIFTQRRRLDENINFNSAITGVTFFQKVKEYRI